MNKIKLKDVKNFEPFFFRNVWKGENEKDKKKKKMSLFLANDLLQKKK